MAELKTKPTGASVKQFIESIEDKQCQADCRKVLAMMRDITGKRPKMWGDSIVGLGSYRYKYSSGREGDWFVAGFSPRKQALTLYLMKGFEGRDEAVSRLGKFKTGKSCLYVKKLEEINEDVLRELIAKSLDGPKIC